MDGRAPIRVEVAYARPDEQLIVPLTVAPGTTAAQAVTQSRIAEHFPEIDPQGCDLGIFGKSVPADRELAEGDRVEIYRPLLADPKEVRKLRAAQGKPMKKGGGSAAGG